MHDKAESDRMRKIGRESGYGWLSVNHYGALVLNANRVLFGDIDCVPDPRNPEKPVSNWRDATRHVGMVAKHYGLTFRVYRTFAGLRLLEVTRLHDPKSPEVRGILSSLACDTAYTALTWRMGNFRVRLSPKPWRAPDTMEFTSEAALAAYENGDSAHSVALYMGDIGQPAALTGEIQTVTRLHDHFCRSTFALPLA